MSGIDESFVNYALLKDIRQAYTAGVFDDLGDVSEDEDRHVSELERRMKALDEKETFVVVKTLKENHSETFEKTIEYLSKKEGETHEEL